MMDPEIHVLEKDNQWIIKNNWSDRIIGKYNSKMLAIGYAVKYSTRCYRNIPVIIHGDGWCKL